MTMSISSDSDEELGGDLLDEVSVTCKENVIVERYTILLCLTLM